ncbi:MAG: DUF805 domain-containing protein [Chloroflexi bacterium]|nr:DUF805 domain-containing protein [Chloroflexota bacterium]
MGLYTSFDGRINRSTFWLKGFLPIFLISVIAAAVDRALGMNNILAGLVSLILLIPNLAIAIKRWHDRDKSGWWILIVLIPIIGWLWALIEEGFLAGTPGPNRFGSPQIS